MRAQSTRPGLPSPDLRRWNGTEEPVYIRRPSSVVERDRVPGREAPDVVRKVSFLRHGGATHEDRNDQDPMAKCGSDLPPNHVPRFVETAVAESVCRLAPTGTDHDEHGAAARQRDIDPFDEICTWRDRVHVHEDATFAEGRNEVVIQPSRMA
jgi:hypothetical protein